MKKLILGLSILGAGVFLSGCYHDSQTAVNNPPVVEVTTTTTPSASDSMVPKSEVKAEETVVKMTSTGFSPSKVMVKVGTSVKFVNDDTAEHWPASAFHPTHQVLPGFDSLSGVKPGESYSYTFEKVGIWKFHDHLNPSMSGSVEVSEK